MGYSGGCGPGHTHWNTPFIVQLLDKSKDNLMMANTKAETCSCTQCNCILLTENVVVL